MLDQTTNDERTDVAMIFLGVVTAHLLGFIVAWAIMMRWSAEHRAICTTDRDRQKSYCLREHRGECWKADGQVKGLDMLETMVPAFFWELTLFPLLAYALATRKPTPRARELEHQKNLRELGFED